MPLTPVSPAAANCTRFILFKTAASAKAVVSKPPAGVEAIYAVGCYRWYP